MRTEYIFWDTERGYRGEDLSRAANILRNGGLVAFPTETVYGLGGNGLDGGAAAKIYAAKGRPSDNPLILHISGREELPPLVAEIPKAAEILMDQYWPGPMTLIFEKSKRVPYETTGGLDTVAVRMPAHEGARRLIAAAAVPVAAPSANLSGRPSPTTAAHVWEDLDGRIDMIVDGGEVGLGLESTILDLTEEAPVILRPGFITKEMLKKVLSDIRVDPGLSGEESGARPKAPGMKYRHYAPQAELTVYEGSTEAVVREINELALQYPEDKVGILATEETRMRYPYGQVVAAGSRREQTIGHELYGALRRFDQLGVERIFSESFSEEAGGDAIMNRLLKAAGHRFVRVPE